MLKRIRNYQKYCWKAMNANKSSEESIIIFFVIFFATISVGTMAVRLNLLDIAMVCALLGLSCQYNQGMNNRMLRQAPVSDRFAVFNLIIVAPLSMVIVVALFIGMLAIIMSSIIMFTTGNGETLERNLIYPWVDIDLIKDWSIRILLFIIRWGVFVLISFYRERIKKIALTIVYVALFLASNWYLVQALRNNEYYGQYTYYEIIELFPCVKWIVISLVFVVILLWIYTWKTCLRLYRTDIKGQKTVKNRREQDVVVQKKSSLSAVIVLVVIFVAFIGGIMIAVFSGSDRKECNIVIDNSQYYYELSVYADEQGLDPELCFADGNQIIFPESIEGVEVKQYHAAIQGEYGDGWCSLAWERLLVATYTEDKYRIEKDRVSTLSVTYRSKTNQVIKDTQHFATETYVAVYDNGMNTYEYAMFDDENRQVVYVYLQDRLPNQIDTDIDIAFKHNASKLVPVKKANTSTRGYSIYSFWNEEDRYFENWWPGKN